ncbi:MAG: rhomboid family intramembrane serine protease [Bacteroidales bacterium]|nr:rhomboid family intramembrane serine protease [Bacteroidales bacterium]
MSIWDEIKNSFKSGTALTRLLYLNVAIFILIKIIEVIGVLSASPALAPTVISFLSVPASIDALLSKPWTPLTYMFTHQGFIHLLFNMLWLWWFGKIFLSYLDQRKLVSLYIMGGLGGAILYVALFNIFPAFAGMVNVSIALGASASVMALVVATAVYLPEMEMHLLFFGRVKLKHLALVTFFITSVFDFSVNTGGKIAHIGGALMGLAYGYGLKNGKDIGDQP